MRYRRVFGAIILACTILGLTLLAACQQRQEIILPAFKPTLKGYANTAFVESRTVGKDNTPAVVFWIEKKPDSKLVLGWGGNVWGEGPIEFSVGMKGEKIMSGQVFAAINGDTQFTGNLDYAESIYTFLGDVRLLGHTFESDKANPLKFKLVEDKGFVLLGGKGTVTTDKGEPIKIN
jgi:hypothetical protein